MSKNVQYVVYIGEEIQQCFSKQEDAENLYNELPSGEGKRPSLRRQLIKETILKQDKR